MDLPELRNFHVTCDGRGVVTAALDVPGRAYNLFTEQVLGELQSLVARLEHDPAARFVIFCSSKESGFLAGGDLREISGLQSLQSAEQIVIIGQKLFDRLEGLSIPTAAVIHGPCLGGGLEFALACRYRIARDDDSTRLGLPEVKLGLLPAWGGTQRLPELVGLEAALPMLLTGRKVSAQQGLKMGLVDAVWPADRWAEGVESSLPPGWKRRRAWQQGRPCRRDAAVHQDPGRLRARARPRLRVHGARRFCRRHAGGWRFAGGMARRCRRSFPPSRKGSAMGGRRDWHGNARSSPNSSLATFAGAGWHVSSGARESGRHEPWVDGLDDRGGAATDGRAVCRPRGDGLPPSGSPLDVGRVRPGRRSRCPRIAGHRAAARRPLRRMVHELAGVGVAAIRHGPHRRGPGDHQPGVPGRGTRIHPGAVGSPRAGADRAAPVEPLFRVAARGHVRNWTPPRPGELRSAKFPHLQWVVRIRGREHPGMLAWQELERAGEGIAAERLEEAQRQLAPSDPINLQYTSGTTGLPKGALLEPPQPAVECLLRRRTSAAGGGRPHLHPGAVVPLFRLRAGHDVRRGQRRGDGLSARELRRRGHAPRHRGRALHRDLRRADHVHRRVGTSQFPPAGYVVAADGNHGRQPLPDRTHEARRRTRWGPARSPSPTARRKRRR